MKQKVYNWQLKRNMDYKYNEVRPKKHAAWIFDINKCIACQTCTLACKNAWTSGKGQEYMWWNNVETKPWGFYPLGWDVQLLDKLKTQKWRRNGTKTSTKEKQFLKPPNTERKFLVTRLNWTITAPLTSEKMKRLFQ